MSVAFNEHTHQPKKEPKIGRRRRTIKQNWG